MNNPQNNKVDDDQRRLMLSLLKVLRRKYPDDFMKMLREFVVK